MGFRFYKTCVVEWMSYYHGVTPKPNFLTPWRQQVQMFIINGHQKVMMEMSAELKMVTTEIHLPGDILYSQGIGKDRVEYFVKKNFLLELYREGKISIGKMADLLEMNLVEMLGIMKDLNVPLNYGVAELEEDIETADRLGLFDEDRQ